MARPRKLNDEHRRLFCALVSSGCSSRKAARFVGVTASAVRLAAIRDAAFGEAVRRAEMNRELVHLQNIRDAGGKTWRASAWMLERLSPDDYRVRPPGAFGAEDVRSLFQGIGEVIASVIPDDALRRRILRKLKSVLRQRQRAAKHSTRRSA